MVINNIIHNGNLILRVYYYKMMFRQKKKSFKETSNILLNVTHVKQQNTQIKCQLNEPHV